MLGIITLIDAAQQNASIPWDQTLFPVMINTEG